MLFTLLAMLVFGVHRADAEQVVIDGPERSGNFGATVTLLPNGNFVVTDPLYDEVNFVVDAGAVYLFRADGTLLSVLRGSSAGDRVGSHGVRVLRSGDYVVCSPFWSNGEREAVGAVTLVHASNSISDQVSTANSLVGVSAGDSVGSECIASLSNGSYVVRSPYWDNGTVVDAGAITLDSGGTGVIGQVSTANSLVGTTAFDQIGSGGVFSLRNGKYVVVSDRWDNGAVPDTGAVTIANDEAAFVGPVTTTNSLVGAAADDRVGSDGVYQLPNSSFVVVSSSWDSGAVSNVGAVTFGHATLGLPAEITPLNSLVGARAGDRIGSLGVTILTNGNFVVRSPLWDSASFMDVGAVTFASGVSGVVGQVSGSNSLIGSQTGDRVGLSSVSPLSNGNYVVSSRAWSNGPIVSAGAVTFASGTTGRSGPVTPSNSLVGGWPGDGVGESITPLANGDYVVASSGWTNAGAASVGAVTLASGTTGITGTVSAANSLLGTTGNDQIGGRGVYALPNSGFVFASPVWDNGGLVDAGAVTFVPPGLGTGGQLSAANSLIGDKAYDHVGESGVKVLSDGSYVAMSPHWGTDMTPYVGAVTYASGNSGVVGVVSADNSLIGSAENDNVGSFGIVPLTAGNYVVVSPMWQNGANQLVGAVTFGRSAIGTFGTVSATNSIVGTTANDGPGTNITGFGNGKYVIVSSNWDNGSSQNAGAVTLASENGSTVGSITTENSVLGVSPGGGARQVFEYDQTRNQLIVGQPADNRVVLFRPGIATSIVMVSDTPDPSGDDQAVTVTAAVSAVPIAPSDGKVTFQASTGERCVSTAPVSISTTTVNFMCTLTFGFSGVRTIVAEFTESANFAFGGSPPETHAVVFLNQVFANGFE